MGVSEDAEICYNSFLASIFQCLVSLTPPDVLAQVQFAYFESAVNKSIACVCVRVCVAHIASAQCKSAIASSSWSTDTWSKWERMRSSSQRTECTRIWRVLLRWRHKAAAEQLIAFLSVFLCFHRATQRRKNPSPPPHLPMQSARANPLRVLEMVYFGKGVTRAVSFTFRVTRHSITFLLLRSYVTCFKLL